MYQIKRGSRFKEKRWFKTNAFLILIAIISTDFFENLYQNTNFY